MRILYLRNQAGEKLYLSYKDSILISSLSGLGFSKTLTYVKFDNTYSLVKQENPLGNITMSLIFLEGYQGYSQFLDYLSRSSSLRLYYKSVDTRYCEVEISEISKEQLVSRTIQSEIKLDKLSLWQKDVTAEIKVIQNTNAKTYPHTYPYIYSETYKGKIRITNNGSESASMRIEIVGAIDNPEVIILKDEEEISKMKMYVKSDDCTLIVDSKETDQIMTLETNGSTESIYQYQDFTCDNFLFINPGTFDIEFKSGVSSNTTCKITFTFRYLGN